jgi:2-polyprenyl-3-methyl-5-hydroxy-6-metoxy-1,4-benzoquinol methylase
MRCRDGEGRTLERKLTNRDDSAGAASGESGSLPYGDNARSDVEPFVPSRARSVLDIGCAFGGFGAALKRARPGIEVWGIEPNREAAQAARTRLDVVVEGRFPEEAPDRQFDCLVFNDVLEHVAYPWDTLRAATQFLTPSGTIVAAIPNVRHFSVIVPLVLRGRWEYRDSGILDRTHLRFFTRRSMIQLFESSGLCVETVAPLRLAPRTSGEIPFLLALFGRRSQELRALNYLIVASAPTTSG